MKIDWATLNQTFEIMGQGMLGIFIVMALISLIVYICTKLSK